jgi:trimeric autotransporter adhesin
MESTSAPPPPLQETLDPSTPTPTIAQLQSELIAARLSLEQKNIAVKTLQTKAQEVVRNIDAKYKIQIDELTLQKSVLEAEAESLRKRPIELEKALQDANSKVLIAETAKLAAENKVIETLAQLESITYTINNNNNSSSLSSSSSSAKIIREEELALAQQECDAAMAVAKSEKKRADDALLARDIAIREARDIRIRTESLSQQVITSTSEISKLSEALFNQQAINKRQSEDHTNYITSIQSQSEDRMLELATALSRAETAESKCLVLEKAEKNHHQILTQTLSETRNYQTEIESLLKEINTLRQTVKSNTAREVSLKSESATLLARITRVESAASNERIEWAAARQRFEDQLVTKASERERLIAEAGRLTRQLDEVSVELRAAKAMVDNHNASAQAARNALSAAENRAADAEARYNMQQTSLRSSEGASGRLRADALALQEETQKLKVTLSEQGILLSNALKREDELIESLNEAIRRANEAEKEAEIHKKRFEDAEKQTIRANREAKDDQRKRLEAKTELVSVAQSFEREKAAFISLSSVVTSNMLPKLLSLCAGLQNLLATLDPAGASTTSSLTIMNDSISIHPTSTTSTLTQESDTLSSSNTSHGLDFDADLDAPIDSDDHSMHMKRFASRLKRSLEYSDKNKATNNNNGGGLITTEASANEILQQRISSLLDQAQASTYAATSIAAKLARKSQLSESQIHHGNNTDTLLSSSGALSLFTSCLFPPAPPIQPIGRGIHQHIERSSPSTPISSSSSSSSSISNLRASNSTTRNTNLTTPKSSSREDASLVQHSDGISRGINTWDVSSLSSKR